MTFPRVPAPVWIPLALVLAAQVSAAERPWIEARSDHFTVVSEANEKSARQVAWQFEQMRAAM